VCIDVCDSYIYAFMINPKVLCQPNMSHSSAICHEFHPN
jgi:hypothetical protein